MFGHRSSSSSSWDLSVFVQLRLKSVLAVCMFVCTETGTWSNISKLLKWMLLFFSLLFFTQLDKCDIFNGNQGSCDALFYITMPTHIFQCSILKKKKGETEWIALLCLDFKVTSKLFFIIIVKLCDIVPQRGTPVVFLIPSSQLNYRFGRVISGDVLGQDDIFDIVVVWPLSWY